MNACLCMCVCVYECVCGCVYECMCISLCACMCAHVSVSMFIEPLRCVVVSTIMIIVDVSMSSSNTPRGSADDGKRLPCDGRFAIVR